MKLAIKFLSVTLIAVSLGGCATPVTSAQKREYQSYQARGITVEEKNPGTGAALGQLPGGDSVSSNVVIIKNLLDKVDSTPITSAEAKIAFRISVENVCRINGVNPKNGFGTTEECLAKINDHADAMCAEQVPGLRNKEYHSKNELRSDFRIYMHCAMNDIEKY